MVARGGIEPPTRGFSVRRRRFQGLSNQSLVALASPDPRHTTAQLRHTKSEVVTISAHPDLARRERFVIPCPGSLPRSRWCPREVHTRATGQRCPARDLNRRGDRKLESARRSVR